MTHCLVDWITEWLNNWTADLKISFQYPEVRELYFKLTESILCDMSMNFEGQFLKRYDTTTILFLLLHHYQSQRVIEWISISFLKKCTKPQNYLKLLLKILPPPFPDYATDFTNFCFKKYCKEQLASKFNIAWWKVSSLREIMKTIIKIF